MEKNSVNFLFARPRNINFYSFTVNGTQESFFYKKEKLYKYICNLVKDPKITPKIYEAIMTGQPFIMDFKNNTLHILDINSEKEIDQLREKILHKATKEVNQEKQEKETKKSLFSFRI